MGNYSGFKYKDWFCYQYDSLNRLKETYYQSHKDYNAWNSSQGYEYGNAYQEQLAYDANGNVLGLKRTDKTGYMVDHLSLTYKSGTNQLMSVSDAAGANKLQGWDAGSSTNQYDLNGNLISGDGATQIVYDVRNLPIRMQKGGQTIVYRYNAAGQRIYKKVIGTTITEEHYVMNGSELVAVLKNGVVDYWRTSYGRYERSSGTFRAKYYITDHLGSTRVVLDESGQRVEAYDYYAFGLVLPGRGFGNNTKEKFTGKERDSETGWDYFGARYYNPTIARWMNVDPLADKYPSWSPYNYVMNSPMMAIDPDGMDNEIVQPNLLMDMQSQEENEMPPDDYIYDEQGKLIRVEKRDAEDRAYMLRNGRKYQLVFNDSEADKFSFLFKQLDIKIVSNGDVRNFVLVNGEITSQAAVCDRYGFVQEGAEYKHSNGGYGKPGVLDFVDEMTDITVRGAHLVLFEGHDRLYNLNDAANFVTGKAISMLNIPYWHVRLGTHLNTLWHHGQLDTDTDQNAVYNGYHYRLETPIVMPKCTPSFEDRIRAIRRY